MDTKRILNQVRFYFLLSAGLVGFSATAVRAQDAAPNGGDSNANGNYSAAYGAQDNSNSADYDAPDNGQDPPTRVARMSYIDGTVSFQPGGQGDWGQATRNRPVTIGDKIWADNNSRAELQAGQAAIHLSSMTALSFLNLDDQTTQLRLAEGSINFRVRELREGEVYEVDTPNVAFNVTQAGAFRIDVNENGDGTRITVIRGEGEAISNGQTYTLHTGERGEFNGTDDNVKYFVAAAPAPDDFDEWSNDRDLRDDNSVSARYVSRDVPGYSDLDDNGTWNEEPEYGHVWYPSAVDVGWAPYSYGSWNYVGPWGWSWVGYEPWGFAPFHYGRWAFIGSRWGWCPGPYYARPIYGPAFVGFLGGGFGFGGGIGWFPLGFREPFHPWYHASGNYYRNVNFNNTNIRNTTIINNRTNNFNYAYAHNVRAVTVSSRNNFVNGQAINRGAFHMTEASLRGAQVTNRTGFAPTRQSFVGAAGSRGNIARPAASIENRAVMARSAPAAGASHLPVRNFGGGNGQAGRGGFNNGNAAASRVPVMGRTAQTEAAANRNRPAYPQGGQSGAPQSHMRTAPADSGANNRSQTTGGNSRNWSAQGNSSDRGRAPSGFGANSSQGAPVNHPDRPAWAGSGNNNPGSSASPRSSGSVVRPGYTDNNRGANSRSYNSPQRTSGYSNSRPSYNTNSSSANSNRGYSPQRAYSPPSQSQPRANSSPRSYSPPQRSYSPPPQSQPRAYSAPRSYNPPQSQPRSYSAPRGNSGPSAPSRSYSPPSRSSAPPSHSSAAPSHSSGGGGGGNSRGSGNTNSRASSAPNNRH